jgi:hypothetical protein
MDSRMFNALFTLRYDTAAGEVVKPDLLAREVHMVEGPKANALGDVEQAWDIAVLDESGTDVTGRFPCFT